MEAVVVTEEEEAMAEEEATAEEAGTVEAAGLVVIGWASSGRGCRPSQTGIRQTHLTSRRISTRSILR